MAKDEELLKQLGLVARRHRELTGLSQEAFSVVVGVHRTYLGAFERGERNITIATLMKISSALGLTPSELLREAEKLARIK